MFANYQHSKQQQHNLENPTTTTTSSLLNRPVLSMILWFSTIRALSEVFSSNSSEILSQWINNNHFRNEKPFFFPHLEHISTFRTRILKNRKKFVKLLEFSTMQALLEVFSSNSSEVITRWTSTDWLRKIALKVCRRLTQDYFKNLK